MKPDTVFLDRDGTINVKADDGRYILSPDGLTLIPGAARAISLLNAASIRVIIVTNQRCVARGLISRASLDDVHERLAGLLAAENGHVDAIYVCPHDIGTCSCRKPAPGLLFQARTDNPSIDLGRSIMIGDSETDVDTAMSAGVNSIRLARDQTRTRAGSVAADLAAAVDSLSL